jgi:hypothetical protein
MRSSKAGQIDWRFWTVSMVRADVPVPPARQVNAGVRRRSLLLSGLAGRGRFLDHRKGTDVYGRVHLQRPRMAFGPAGKDPSSADPSSADPSPAVRSPAVPRRSDPNGADPGSGAVPGLRGRQDMLEYGDPPPAPPICWAREVCLRASSGNMWRGAHAGILRGAA